jgi:WD40 repeat protein
VGSSEPSHTGFKRWLVSFDSEVRNMNLPHDRTSFGIGTLGVPLIAALVALLAISTTAQTVRPKIDVVLQLANSLSEDEPYGVNPTALVFSPNQRRVASGDTNGVVKLWNVSDGRLIRTIPHPQQVTAVAFTPDGRRLITAAGTIRSWDAETGRLIHNFEESFRTSAVLAVSSDGVRVVAGTDDASAREWDITSGRKVRDYVRDLSGSPISAAVYSQDRQLLATAYDGGIVRVWNTETGEIVRTLTGDDQTIGPLSFSPDGGRLLVYTIAGTASVWEVATGRLVRAQKGGETSVLAFWTDWKRARVCCGDAVTTFEVMAPRSTRAAIPEINNPTAAAFSPDGTLVVIGARDGTLRLLQAESGKPTRIFNLPTATTIASIALSGDGTQVIAGENGPRIQVWDLSAARLARTIETEIERIYSLGMSPDGQRVVVSDGLKFELREVATGRLIRTFDRGDQDLRPVVPSPDVRLILAPNPDDGSLGLWDVEDGRLVRGLAGDLKGASWAAFSGDGRLLATDGEPRSVRIFDVATGQLVRTLKGLEEAARPVGFSFDGRRILVASGDTPGTRLVDVETGKRVGAGVYPEAGSYTFSPNGQRLLTLSHEDNQLIATESGQPIVAVAGSIPFQIPGEFLPDSQSFITGSYDTTLTRRDVITGAILNTYAGHTGAVIALAIARDSKRAVSGSPDTTIRLWNVDTGETLATLLAARNGEWIIVTPEGFFSASANGADLANAVSGFEVFPLQRFHALLHRPDLVAEKIAGDPKGLVRDAFAKLDTAHALAAARQVK